MPFGYTLFDPVIVLSVCSLILYYLSSKPVMVLGWLPAAVSIYFFIPFITLISLGQLVAILLILYFFIRNKKLVLQPSMSVAMAFFLLSLLASGGYAVAISGDIPRMLIRSVFYFGIFAVFLFSYEMGLKETAMPILIKGLILLGVVLAIYGIYQIVAQSAGLPFRGIVRGTFGAQSAHEYGIPRINSLASEPKRLGYVLFISCLACFEWARRNPDKEIKYKFAGVGIFLVSTLTLSGSYFLTLLIFVLSRSLLDFKRQALRSVLLCFSVIVLSVQLSSTQFGEAITAGYDRRMSEIELGLDGQKVYRQEFYAQDFLLTNPEHILFGVGIGQYYSVLNSAYFPGVGKSDTGELIPLNSQVLEMLLDTNILAILLFYLGLLRLVLRLKRRGELFLFYALLFLVAQSFTIQTLPFLATLAGFSFGYLYRRDALCGGAVEQLKSN